MTRLTRNFMLGSAVVVLLGLCTGLVAYYNGGLPIGPAGNPSELSYLPQGTNVVAQADVAAIMKSDFRKHLPQSLQTGEEKQKLQDETGIDLEKDIDSVVAGFGNSQQAAQGTLVFTRGRFDQA